MQFIQRIVESVYLFAQNFPLLWSLELPEISATSFPCTREIVLITVPPYMLVGKQEACLPQYAEVCIISWKATSHLPHNVT